VHDFAHWLYTHRPLAPQSVFTEQGFSLLAPGSPSNSCTAKGEPPTRTPPTA
jgi:hypothetical protein